MENGLIFYARAFGIDKASLGLSLNVQALTFISQKFISYTVVSADRLWNLDRV